jgi:hypothetical protein
MRTKKENMENHKVISFVGKLIETRFIPFGETYAQELEVKSGKETQKLIFPFVKPHEIKKGEERRWNAIEKERQIVSYSIATPEKKEKEKSSLLKKFWSDAITCKITLDYDGKGNKIEWEKKGFIPYERKAERVKYLEVVQEGLDVSFFTSKITQNQTKK